MMKKKFLASILSLTIFCIVGVVVVYAQTSGTGNTGGTSGSGSTVSIPINIPNPLGGTTSLHALLQKIINNILLPIGGVLAVLAFIYSGFLYVTAQGNEASLKTAHKALLYTSIGTAVLLGSWVLANMICRTIELIGGSKICM